MELFVNIFGQLFSINSATVHIQNIIKGTHQFPVGSINKLNRLSPFGNQIFYNIEFYFMKGAATD